jgi:hypothetical protein
MTSQFVTVNLGMHRREMNLPRSHAREIWNVQPWQVS